MLNSSSANVRERGAAATGDVVLVCRTAGRLVQRANGSQECQIPSQHHSALSILWASDDRTDDKVTLFKAVVLNCEGTPLLVLVRLVFGRQSVDAGGSDYQLARRFVRQCEYAKTNRQDWLVWCFPTVDSLHLSQQYAGGRTTKWRGDSVSSGAN
jgi:hypothetical protein